ncbi:MAG: hypothetical protein IJW90_00400 [Clostridia bacterium]|nr:hypothetical protein [Clostridia bacterium]
MDIRIDTKFFQHPKTLKLQRRLGFEGVIALLRLWCWAAENRPLGQLTGIDEEDIELITNWAGADRKLVPVLLELHWLDQGEEGVLLLHEWVEHNSWVAGAPARGDKARFSKLADVAPNIYRRLAQQGRDSISKEEYSRLVVESTSNRQQTDVGVTSPPPPPQPSPNIKKFQSTAPLATGPEAKETALLRLYRKFPGYRADVEIRERVWIRSLLSEYSDNIDITGELNDALAWVQKKKFKIRNSRSFIIEWLKRVRKGRNSEHS